jgi:acetyl-CoA C-acetyltransferase
VTANGGMLSKHASGIYSRKPSSIDWGSTETLISVDVLPACKMCADPKRGSIISYTVRHDREGGAHAMIIGETISGERFVSRTAKDDNATAFAMLAQDPTGRKVKVTAPDDERIYFQLG